MANIYYDDPLAADYMAREYGVKYEEVPELEVDSNAYIMTLYTDDGLYEGPKHFTITPDSLHIFEPKAWDLGMDEYENIYEHYKEWYLSNDEGVWDGRPIKIIRRENKPFFWPKGGDDE